MEGILHLLNSTDQEIIPTLIGSWRFDEFPMYKCGKVMQSLLYGKLALICGVIIGKTVG